MSSPALSSLRCHGWTRRGKGPRACRPSHELFLATAAAPSCFLLPARTGFTQADGALLDSANIKRSRLTSELQQAYAEWLRATDDQTLQDGADISAGNRERKWCANLAA